MVSDRSKIVFFRFRNYLSSDMAALIPFLISVRWTMTDEQADTLDMLQEWTPKIRGDCQNGSKKAVTEIRHVYKYIENAKIAHFDF